MGALLPPEGPPPLAGEPEALLLAALDALLAELVAEAELLEALLAELLLEALLLEELLLEDAAVCSSSEKSISSGGSPSLLVEGSGGMLLSSGRRSDSLYTGDDGWLFRAVGSGMESDAELWRRLCSSPLLAAVVASRLASLPDSMVGMLVFVRLSLLFGMLWLGEEREELLEEVLLAVCGWLWLRLEDGLLGLGCDWDWDCEDELDDGCWGWAGGCCWVCWVLQPAITALSTMTEARVRQLRVCCVEPGTAIRRVIVLS
ncbi:hypothetical protein [Microbulbifer guangxiensis]|uniref:hypothetical protein n=1 Tax=Microbulbifer guangxiensis TaxID=2904249 RepID=UPI001F2E010D|nr:hypothetical protein [Microbulbifer guangxiensis]